MPPFHEMLDEIVDTVEIRGYFKGLYSRIRAQPVLEISCFASSPRSDERTSGLPLCCLYWRLHVNQMRMQDVVTT